MSPSAALKQNTKGEETRSQILAAAVQQASRCGFESLTIGTLAEKTGLSKSGLFAHFGSKQDLQLAALEEAARMFTDEVFRPALKAPRGVKRLKALIENWVSWPQRANLPGGCPVDQATREYMHTPGPMREAAIARQHQLDRELTRAVQLAIDAGELAKKTDARQMAYELVAIVLASYRVTPLRGEDEGYKFAHAAFDRLIEANRP
ncbi:MAG TPA: TetR/AcrR family transcriptional regulator [Usitatibacter sp.]|jgi:AcrR family transcriptional regulator|nr:TetR/AcrR family transcriptional regulator [Usitatibacter sp.]